MTHTVALVAIAALLVGGGILIVVELSNGARTYGSTELHDPCEPREQFPGDGIEGTLQRVALDGIDGAACSLSLGREELVLSFVPEVAPEDVQWTDEVIAEALRGGFDRAIAEAEDRGTLGAASDAGTLGRFQSFALREVVERLPVTVFTDIGLSVAEALGNEPPPWDRDTIIDAVREGIISAIDAAEESGALPSLAATPLREIVRRAPVSKLIGVGETIAGLLN